MPWAAAALRVRVGRLRRAVPLPAPSRNRGAAPDPAPQAPEGLDGPDPGFSGAGGQIQPVRRLRTSFSLAGV
ncbi:hypothetical protein DDV98_24450 [Streptomyces sp. IB2014 011-12]|nr:hypothetical protein DDV98_24450 [Streptomyces sp. IB2014 011-12]